MAFPEYTELRSTVPRGSAVVTHVAAEPETAWLEQLGTLVYVLPLVEYWKFTVPVAPDVTVAVIVTDVPTT